MRLAVIPARGGSKRIPRKNIREFGGKPMIAWSLEAARASGVFDRIIVSTDDEEIAEIARAHGGETPFIRPAELADDHAGTSAVIAHAIRWAESEGVAPDAVCCIYATAPFLEPTDLQTGLAEFETGNWDFVFSACAYAAPVQRAFTRAEDGRVSMLYPEFYDHRSQDLPQALHDAGQFYWGRPAAWLEGRRIFGPASTVVLVPRWRVHDIDNEDDWRLAELVRTVIRGNQA